MDNLHYNFVFFFARYDFLRSVLGEELYNNKHVRVYKEAFSGPRFLQRIFHYHWAYSINRKICLPFKQIWFKKMYKQDFEEDLPIVFVYLAGGTIYYGKDFLKYVKKQNPNNRNVMLYADLLGNGKDNEHFLLKDLVDLEITYDAGEAQKYDIEYYQRIIYSKLISEPQTPDIKYDVYFLGSAKDRLSKIHNAFLFFKKNGLKCKFIVAGVSKDQQIEGVEYTSGISYEQNLKYVLQSKSILEIMQGGSCDITMRAREAIAYRRRFITDCQLDLSNYFNDNQLLQYKKIQDINTQFLKEDFCPDDYNPVVDMNPLQRLYFIQEKLDEKNERIT